MGSFFKSNFSKVEYFYPTTRMVIALIAIVLSLQLIPELVANIISILLVVSIGLMHGATDHILYVNSEGASFKSKIPKPFIIKYLLILVSMGIIWLIAPLLALVFFLAVSAYHFGQTQLQYIAISEASGYKKVLYLAWGILMLALIVLLNLDESKGLINSAIPSLNLYWLDAQQSNYVILIAAFVFLITYAILYKHIALKTVVFELVEILLVAFLAYQSNLIITFGVFFGLWHSLRASQIQIQKVSTVQNYSFKLFVKESLPFTLISIFGIGLMMLIATFFESSIKVEMLFLVAISMLTLPHMFIYERFYNYFDLRKK
jgi:Brp/Blh family beta-carotene 15,15'-monooxygenase